MHTKLFVAVCMAELCWVWADCYLTEEAYRYGADSSLVVHIVHAAGGASDSYIGCITHKHYDSKSLELFDSVLACTALFHML